MEVAEPLSPGRKIYSIKGRGLGLSLLFGLLLALSCEAEEKPAAHVQMPVNVEVVTVKVEPLEKILTAVGSLSSPQETVVAPQISGKIVALNIAQGQVVNEGAVLARLDDAIQKAAVAAAESSLANARQIFERDRKVAGTGAVSEQQLLTDQTAVQQAEALLEEARTNLRYTVIRSPFTGALGLRQVSLGAYLAQGDAIVAIRQLDPLHLDFDLPQEDIRQIKPGQEARFSVAGLTGEFTGRVTTIDQAMDVSARTFHVQATVPNPDQGLKPGMFTYIRLVVGTIPDALFVPAQAVVPEGEVRHVWVVGQGDRAEQRTVTVGEYGEDRVQILSGLTPADRVVTAGVQKLYPGAGLVIAPYQPIHNPRLDLTNPEEKTAP